MKRIALEIIAVVLAVALGLSACLDSDEKSRGDDDEKKQEAEDACDDAKDNLEDVCGDLSGYYDLFFKNCEDVYLDEDCGSDVEDFLDCLKDIEGGESCSGETMLCAEDWAKILSESSCKDEILGGETSDGDSVATDGDETQTDGDTVNPTGCTGTCNPNSDAPKCEGVDVCVCDRGNWSLYKCSDVCSIESKVSKGCGMVEGMQYCICESSVEPDGDVDDPCDPNPCNEVNKNVCTNNGAGGFTCSCNSGYHEEEGVCVADSSGDVLTTAKFCELAPSSALGNLSQMCLTIGSNISMQTAMENCSPCFDLTSMDANAVLGFTDCAGQQVFDMTGKTPNQMVEGGLQSGYDYIFIITPPDESQQFSIGALSLDKSQGGSCSAVTYQDVYGYVTGQ